MSRDERTVVACDYESERGLLGRRAAYRYAVGPDALELTFAAVAEAAPRRVLEVGCGPGELAERIGRELGADVVALDSSPRMVELARARGVAADVGDVQDLPFGDGEFDCAVAAWMLYHVPDVERALGELARVLRPRGRLVATTNHRDHLGELRALVAAPPRRRSGFDGDEGLDVLRRHFERAEARDARAEIRFPDRDAVAAYVESAAVLFGESSEVPLDLELPFVVTAHPVVFVAETAA